MDKETSSQLKEKPKLTVDGVIIKNQEILLIKRATEPFIDFWALPGGFVEYYETTERAVKREIKEETGLTAKTKKIIGVYSKPNRDPRGHIISIVYLLEIIKGTARATKEAREIRYFEFKNLPKNIAFDHRKIINDAVIQYIVNFKKIRKENKNIPERRIKKNIKNIIIKEFR